MSSKAKTEIYNLGFTLAEVLITLGIIGVVAAMTIPTLMNNIQDQQWKTAYKKAYASAYQALNSANGNEEMLSRPSWTDGATRVQNFETFKKYFKVIKDCPDLGDTSACWNRSAEIPSWPSATAPAFIDTSGMAWAVNADSTASSGGELRLDTNGLKGPNKYGQDRFVFWPLSSTNTYDGIPTKLMVSDCLGTAVADCSSQSYIGYCPSVATHPCYYSTWLYN